MCRAIVVALVAVVPTSFVAQAPFFDVVSVKPTPPGQTGGMFQVQPGGRIAAHNLTVNALIGLAYSTDLTQLLPDQITSGPTWIHTERFDIDGRIAVTTIDDVAPSASVVRQLLQGVLRDRFKLVTHTESRELPVYALVFAREGRALGAHLRPAADDCAALTTAPCTWVTDSSIHARGLPFANFVLMLQSALGRQAVINESGLSGLYDIDLEWAPVSGAANDTSDGPSIFTAVQEQLGLKLDARKMPRDVLVIDHIERPTED